MGGTCQGYDFEHNLVIFCCKFPNDLFLAVLSLLICFCLVKMFCKYELVMVDFDD